jgi:hypothetical protein
MIFVGLDIPTKISVNSLSDLEKKNRWTLLNRDPW